MKLARSLLILIVAVIACTHAPEVKKTWDGAQYHKNSGSQLTAAQHLLKRYQFKGDERVLDIGCGDGKITAQIAGQLPKGNALGVDKSESMIGFATQAFGNDKTKNLRFELKDATQLNYENEFDVAVSFSTLHWVLEQDKALKGVFRSLKPGGKVFISMPDGYPEALSGAIGLVANKSKWSNYFVGFKRPQIFFTTKEYTELLKNAGFDRIESERIPMFDYFESKEAFSNFLRQWLPYLQPVPPEKRDEFMAELMDEYVKLGTMDAAGRVGFYKYTLEAQAEKT